MRYVEDVFTESFITTIGIDFKLKTIIVDNLAIKLQIWDTAGQERFKSLMPMYYRGANIAIFVFDITNKETLDRCKELIQEVESNCAPDIIICIAANKYDLIHTKLCEVHLNEVRKFVKEMDYMYFEVSAKENRNIQQLFAETGMSMDYRCAFDSKLNE